MSQDDDIDLGDFRFHSTDHRRYERDVLVDGPHGHGAPRRVLVQCDTVPDIYVVTVYDAEIGPHYPMHAMKVAPKPMRVIERTAHVVRLRGWGCDERFGAGIRFDSFELEIHRSGKQVHKVVLLINHRHIRIEYLP